MTRQRFIPSCCQTYRACVVLAVLLSCAVASAQTYEQAMSEALRASGQLENLRLVPQRATPEKVDELLTEGLAGLAEAGAALADQQASPAVQARQFQIHFHRGELHRLAAAALPADDPRREQHLQTALREYRERFEYRDVAASRLGYLGEARVNRVLGKLTEAEGSLLSILNDPPGPNQPAEAYIWWLAKVEQIEILAERDPPRAQREVAMLRAERDELPVPEQPGAIKWLEAQAMTAAALSASDYSRTGFDASKLLRNPDVIAYAPHYRRLELLAKLDASGGPRVMTADEVVEWAAVQARIERDNAAVALFESAGERGEPQPKTDWLRAYAAALWRTGNLGRAMDVWDRCLAVTPPGDPQRDEVLRLRARCALAVLDSIQGDVQGELIERIAAVQLAVVDGVADEPARREALRHWVDVRSRLGGWAALGDRLDDMPGLVDGDAYLLYCRASSAWARANDPGAEAPPPTQLADAIINDLQQAQALGDEAGQGDLSARAVLLRIQVMSSPPMNRTRAAYDLLESESERLASSTVAALADQVRAGLQYRLGLVDAAAETYLSQTANSGGGGDPGTMLRVAQRLVARYRALEPGGRGQVQQQVIQLAQRAAAASTRDPAAHASTVIAAARLMLDVEADEDARGLLASVADASDLDEQDRSTIRLMRAELAYKSGDTGRAYELIRAAADEQPDSPKVRLILGRYWLHEGEAELALPSLRAARAGLAAGSDLWWDATLALAEAHAWMGNRDDALTLLRLNEAMHPVDDRPVLRQQIAAAREMILALPVPDADQNP